MKYKIKNESCKLKTDRPEKGKSFLETMVICSMYNTFFDYSSFSIRVLGSQKVKRSFMSLLNRFLYAKNFRFIVRSCLFSILELWGT